MKNFTSVADVPNVSDLVDQALALKAAPHQFSELGKHKTLILLFFNSSLRTRLSTEKAGYNLGMSVIMMNAAQGWQLEFSDRVVMQSDKAEHIREAAAVVSQYGDVIGIRTFAGLTDRDRDYDDFILQRFIEFAQVPVISLESAIRHPLQSLTDLMTIREHQTVDRPKVVLSWAPHPRALPQAVANSFVEWVRATNAELVITHPEGYELAPTFVQDTPVVYDQAEALTNADFVYVKNWSSYRSYGKILQRDASWMMSTEKLARTRQAKLMHCLPVRRNVVIADDVLDGPHSLVIEQANNRTYAAQAVLKQILATTL